MALEAVNLLASFRVPQSHKKLALGSGMTGQNPFAIAREIDAADKIGDAGESFHFFARFQVPESKRAIEACRNQAICLGGECNRVDPGLMALQRLRDLARLDIADSDNRVVLVSGGELLSVMGYR